MSGSSVIHVHARGRLQVLRWPVAAGNVARVADLLISRVMPGVTLVKSVDPFDTLEIHRIDRSRWQHTPEMPGIYLLYGVTPEGKLTVYVGMSETSMRNRVRKHHVTHARL